MHYSIYYVFKGNNSADYKEDVYIEPINKYGETKVLGEKLLKLTTDKFYLIRLSRLFGLAGESTMTKKSFVDIMLDLVINKNKKELDLVDDEKSLPNLCARSC